MTDRSEHLAQASELLHREAMCLDERRWDEWLALYVPDCHYWMPAWRDDSTLNDDPMRQLSYIYYQSRKGLEDRVLKLRSTRKAPSTTPMPRTAHLVGNVLPLAPADVAPPGQFGVRATWVSHVLYTHARVQHVFFGSSRYAFRREGSDWLITSKKIVLQNDDVPSMLDFYCV